MIHLRHLHLHLRLRLCLPHLHLRQLSAHRLIDRRMSTQGYTSERHPTQGLLKHRVGTEDHDHSTEQA